MTNTELFAPDYSTARARFREAASRRGWRTEALPIEAVGPSGEELTIDIACSATTGDRTLVVSSGVHGVEGFFGSAVQINLLEEGLCDSSEVKFVFIHGLNPYGFAWLRRFGENNVDLNRNFLLQGERYEGSPAGYVELESLLNPQREPSRWEPFLLKALWQIQRRGLSAVKQSVAGGQYEFPEGLFFGGRKPTQSHELMRNHLGRWLQGARRVVHLDFHSGLGPSAKGVLLIDYPIHSGQRDWLARWVGADSFRLCTMNGDHYSAKGAFGAWCVSQHLAESYLYACAEYGTYGPIKMLAGLRAENQLHHWQPGCSLTDPAKRHLKELFCPADSAWRTAVLTHSRQLVERCIQGLLD